MSILTWAVGAVAAAGAYKWWEKGKDENTYRALRRQLQLDGRIEDIHYLEEWADPNSDSLDEEFWYEYFYGDPQKYGLGTEDEDSYPSELVTVEQFERLYGHYQDED